MNKLPKEITMLELTLSNICNSRCKMCDIGTEKFEKKEMSIQEIEKIFDSEISHRVQVISLCGGEPFLRKDFVKIVKLIGKKLNKKFNLNVSSNGMDTKKIIDDIGNIIDDVNLTLVFSLDGLEKTHNQQRGLDNAFQKTMQTIENVKERFPKIEINLHMTITPLNYKEIYDVYKIAISRNMIFRTSFAHNVPYLTNFINKQNPLCEFTEENISIIQKQLNHIVNEHIKKGNFGDALFLNQIPKRMRDNNYRFGRCFTSNNLILIKENSDVHICVMSAPIGNINNQGLDEIFLSDKAENIRKQAAEYACPNCMMLCGSYFNYERLGKLLSSFYKRNKLVQKEGKTISRPLAPCMSSLKERKTLKDFNQKTSCKDCNELFVVDKEGTIKLCEELRRIEIEEDFSIIKDLNKEKECYKDCNPFLRNKCLCLKNKKE